MGFFTILLTLNIFGVHFRTNCEVIRNSVSEKQLGRIEQAFETKLLNMEKMFEEKMNKLNNKVSTLDKTVSQLNVKINGGVHTGRGFRVGKKGPTDPVDCTIEDERTLYTKPVCDYGKCDDWSPWGSCDIKTQQQTRKRLCHSKYMILCKTKTETETKYCGKLCEFTNCTDWTTWSPCRVSRLGEQGFTLRTKTCLTNNRQCEINNRTETETKTCESDCEMDHCTPWASWSGCDVLGIQQRRTKKRARKCGTDSQFCSSKTEFQIGVCNATCPDGYMNTSYGTCLKCFYRHETWYDAEKVCQQDGGHLINFDNNNKSDEVHALFPNLWTGFWIDGLQNATGGNWLFRGGNSGYTSWGAGEPREDQGHAMCVYMDHQNWYWHSFDCSSLGNFMCERKQMD